MAKITCIEENAQQFFNWIKHRGGILTWKSINLSNPGASWNTPALDDQGQPVTKPTWQVENAPEKTTDINEVVVSIDKEVKRFHVAVERHGLQMKVTDGGSRKISFEITRAGEGSYYTFDYGSEKNCIIYRQDKTVPLAEYAQQKEWI